MGKVNKCPLIFQGNFNSRYVFQNVDLRTVPGPFINLVKWIGKTD